MPNQRRPNQANRAARQQRIQDLIGAEIPNGTPRPFGAPIRPQRPPAPPPRPGPRATRFGPPIRPQQATAQPAPDPLARFRYRPLYEFQREGGRPLSRTYRGGGGFNRNTIFRRGSQQPNQERILQ